MPSLAIIVGGCIFIAVGLVVLFSDFNWQGALVLFAIGIGLILFFLKR